MCTHASADTAHCSSGADEIHATDVSNGDANRLARGSPYEAGGRRVWFISSPEDVYTSYSHAR
jgi:hypothetical protein